MAAGNKASAFRADTASTVVPTHPPSTASSTAALGPETLDVAIRGIANEKTPGLEHSLGLKRATGKSCRSVVIGKTHEHPITDMSRGLIGGGAENPRSWPQRDKMVALMLISLITLVS